MHAPCIVAGSANQRHSELQAGRTIFDGRLVLTDLGLAPWKPFPNLGIPSATWTMETVAGDNIT